MNASEWHAGMTLGEARRLLAGPGWACACTGPPMPSPRGTPCWCRLTFAQARALHRAAHIVARLLSERRE